MNPEIKDTGNIYIGEATATYALESYPEGVDICHNFTHWVSKDFWKIHESFNAVKSH